MIPDFDIPAATLLNETGASIDVTFSFGTLTVDGNTFALADYDEADDLVDAVNALSGITMEIGGMLGAADPAVIDWFASTTIADTADALIATYAQSTRMSEDAIGGYAHNLGRAAAGLLGRTPALVPKMGDSLSVLGTGAVDRNIQGWVIRSFADLVTGSNDFLAGFLMSPTPQNNAFHGSSLDVSPGNVGNQTSDNDHEIGPAGNTEFFYFPTGADLVWYDGADLDGSARRTMVRYRISQFFSIFPENTTTPGYRSPKTLGSGEKLVCVPVIYWTDPGPTQLSVLPIFNNPPSRFAVDLSSAQDRTILPLLHPSAPYEGFGNGGSIPGNGNIDVELPPGQTAFGTPTSTGYLTHLGMWVLKTLSDGVTIRPGKVFWSMAAGSASFEGAAADRDATAADDKTWNYDRIAELLLTLPPQVRETFALRPIIDFALEVGDVARYQSLGERIIDNWVRAGKAAGITDVVVTLHVPMQHSLGGIASNLRPELFRNAAEGFRRAVDNGRQEHGAVLSGFHRTGGWRNNSTGLNLLLAGDRSGNDYGAFDLDNDGADEDARIDLLDAAELHPGSDIGAQMQAEVMVMAAREASEAGDVLSVSTGAAPVRQGLRSGGVR